LFELFLELISGRGFVNRGFFYGPIVPVYAFGFFLSYAIYIFFKDYPAVVFFVTMAVCTVLEYITGHLLEKYLHMRAWDYDLNPLTFWCNYKRRIALTATLAFGLFSLLTFYVFWEAIRGLFAALGAGVIVVCDGIFSAVFLVDLGVSFRKYIQNKKAGIPSMAQGLCCDTAHENEFFRIAASDIITNRIFLKSRNFIQHGKTSIYEHSIAVAKMCNKLSTFWKVKNRTAMIRAALLHDFFLYDWHTEKKLTHGFTHPVTAAENARLYFCVSPKEYSLIRTHMWPFTLLHPPRYIEGWYICFFDKIVTIQEMLRLTSHGPDAPVHRRPPSRPKFKTKLMRILRGAPALFKRPSPKSNGGAGGLL
jgi:uncharacterized protein